MVLTNKLRDPSSSGVGVRVSRDIATAGVRGCLQSHVKHSRTCAGPPQSDHCDQVGPGDKDFTFIPQLVGYRWPKARARL